MELAIQGISLLFFAIFHILFSWVFLVYLCPWRAFFGLQAKQSPPDAKRPAMPVDCHPGQNQKNSIMDNSIMELAKTYPGVSITIQAGDLEKFGNALIEGTMKRYREDFAAREAEERQEKLLTAKEVAKTFGVCTKTITRWRKAGIITPVPVGGLLKYKSSDCRRIIEAKDKAQAGA